MIERREGITTGQPPKHLGYEDDLHKVVGCVNEKRSGQLQYEVECKLCGGVHLRISRELTQKSVSRSCPHFKPHNWSGIDRWDGIIRRVYGITLAEYEEKLKAQGGVCQICGKPDEVEGRRMAIDHCHKTGAVRGLLCGNCNRGLGNFQDSPELVAKAAEYLLKYANAR